MKQYVLAFAAGAVYCTPLLDVELELSVEGQTLDTTRLHVRGRKNCARKACA